MLSLRWGERGFAAGPVREGGKRKTYPLQQKRWVPGIRPVIITAGRARRAYVFTSALSIRPAAIPCLGSLRKTEVGLPTLLLHIPDVMNGGHPSVFGPTAQTCRALSYCDS